MRDSKKACQRKIKYSLNEAKTQIRVRAKDKGIHGSYYKCDNCGKYHVTRKSRSIPERVWAKIYR